MKLSRRIKNAKRTKRTKRTKRKNHTKLRRKTKQQFRQYRRKNTYRKHSHKLKQNKRVHRGGDGENLLSNRQVELQYTTDDSSWINRARGVLNKLQTGNFKYNITYDSREEPNIGLNQVFKTQYRITDYNPFKEKNYGSLRVDSNDVYRFKLSMTKDTKNLVVIFTITVKGYTLSIITGKVPHIEETGYVDHFTKELKMRKNHAYHGDVRDLKTNFVLQDSSLTYDVTYTSGGDNKSIPIPSRNTNNMIIKTETEKTYTFPPPHDSMPYNFFNKVVEDCKRIVFNKMTVQLSKIVPLIDASSVTPNPTGATPENTDSPPAATSTSLDATPENTDSPLAAIPTVTPTGATPENTDSALETSSTDENTG